MGVDGYGGNMILDGQELAGVAREAGDGGALVAMDEELPVGSPCFTLDGDLLDGMDTGMQHHTGMRHHTGYRHWHYEWVH
jgi:hypothetical protein